MRHNKHTAIILNTVLALTLTLLAGCAREASAGLPTPGASASGPTTPPPGATQTLVPTIPPPGPTHTLVPTFQPPPTQGGTLVPTFQPPPPPQPTFAPPQPTFEPPPLPVATVIVTVIVKKPVPVYPSRPKWPPSGCRTYYYVVRPGDNLFRIGLRYGTTATAIARQNGIPDIRLINPGQRLRITVC